MSAGAVVAFDRGPPPDLGSLIGGAAAGVLRTAMLTGAWSGAVPLAPELAPQGVLGCPVQEALLQPAPAPELGLLPGRPLLLATLREELRAATLLCRDEVGRGGASDFDLSRGKIVDVLRRDYPEFFDREPDFGIYHEDIVLEIGALINRPLLQRRGKEKYVRALSNLRTLALRYVQDGKVLCRVADGEPYSHSLRVPWTCTGEIHMPVLGNTRIHVSANSFYSLAPQVISGDPGSAEQPLPYLINRHCLEFVEVHPPSLRGFLSEKWWGAQTCPEPIPCA